MLDDINAPPLGKKRRRQLKRELKALKESGSLFPRRPVEPGATPRDTPSLPRGVSSLTAAVIKQHGRPQPLRRDMLAPYKPPPGVLPPGQSVIAMDEVSGWAMDDYGVSSSDWGLGVSNANTSGFGVQYFMGFPSLALLAQRAEYRVISEIIATEMTRKWIKLVSVDGKERQVEFDGINAEMVRLKVRECFHKVAEHDGFFGRGHIVPIFNKEPDDLELKTDIGDGVDKVSQTKVGKGSIKALRVIEPMWIYPAQYNSTNPLRDDWYKPSQWYVQTKTVHTSRLLTFVGREVPDLLKPSYAFGGLSMTQMVMPSVENWLGIRSGVYSIIKSFSVFVLKTNAAELLAGGNADEFYNRLAIFNSTRSTLDVMAIDMKSEDFQSVSAPLGGLDRLQSQAQEGMASISRIPLVKLTGISPSGLNATGESEMVCFEDFIHSYQEMFFRPNLNKLLGLIQLSLYGKIDDQIGFEFLPLGELTAAEEAELRQVNASTGEILIRAKAISSHEERTRVVMDVEGPYNGLDPDENVTYPMTEVEKASYAASIATISATLVAEGIIQTPTALREIMTAAKISGFGLTITDADVTEAENAPPPPAPGDPNDPNGGPPPAPPKPSGGFSPGATKGIGGGGAADAAHDAEWNEADHPRGQPENAGQFGAGGNSNKSDQPNVSVKAGHQVTVVREGKRLTASGEPLPAHVAALKIPPAWTDVTYSDDPKAALQAVGRDAKGRRQSVYLESFEANNAAAKFSRIVSLDKKIVSITSKNEKFRSSSDEKKAASADCTKLIISTGIRPGSDADTGAEKKAYGATTLVGKHVVVDGDSVSLKFVGKKGVALDIPVSDPDTAAMLIKRKALVGDEGKLFGINDKTLLAHVHTLGPFKTKDFRTLLGTTTAADEVARRPTPTNAKEYKKAVMEVAKVVSTKLGNTPVIALQSYINPAVFAEWRVAA